MEAIKEWRRHKCINNEAISIDWPRETRPGYPQSGLLAPGRLVCNAVKWLLHLVPINVAARHSDSHMHLISWLPYTLGTCAILWCRQAIWIMVIVSLWETLSPPSYRAEHYPSVMPSVIFITHILWCFILLQFFVFFVCLIVSLFRVCLVIWMFSVCVISESRQADTPLAGKIEHESGGSNKL